jgi:Colicin E5 ribonuclease domain
MGKIDVLIKAANYGIKGAKWAGRKAKEGYQKAKEWWKGDKKKKKKDEQCPTGKCDQTEWKADNIKDQEKLKRQMEQRGWTNEQISEAVEKGQQFPAKNFQSGNPATRYVHPTTGRSVIIDDVTKGIIQVGGDGFRF